MVFLQNLGVALIQVNLLLHKILWVQIGFVFFFLLQVMYKGKATP